MPITHDCAAVWEQGCLHEDIRIFNLLCRHLSLVQIMNSRKFHQHDHLYLLRRSCLLWDLLSIGP